MPLPPPLLLQLWLWLLLLRLPPPPAIVAPARRAQVSSHVLSVVDARAVATSDAALEPSLAGFRLFAALNTVVGLGMLAPLALFWLGVGQLHVLVVLGSLEAALSFFAALGFLWYGASLWQVGGAPACESERTNEAEARARVIRCE